MYKLLNRISHLVSFIMGFIITLMFVSTDVSRIGVEQIISSIFIGFFVGLLFKKIFLGKQFIESRLQYFAETILENKGLISNTKPKKHLENIPDSSIEKSNKTDYKYTSTKDIYNIQESIDNNDDLEKLYEVVEKTPIKTSHKTKTKPSEPSKFELAISKFFSENLLAKLGGILVFLGVLFLLNLVYSQIGPVGKLIIGFVIGFGVYFAGVLLDKKDLQNEGRILLGIGILINYLVILGGRYLIGDTVDNSYLSIGTTFLFLIFNTFFAVLTSLVYKSRTLLLFSFIFAFINPLLIGGTSDNPYTILGYSLIVAFGGLFLSLKQRDVVLAFGVFILSNMLFLVSPVNIELHWILKLVSSAIISISSIYTVYKIDSTQLSWVFLGSYIYLVLNMGTAENYLKETTSFISYMITLVLYFSIGIYYFLRTSFNSLVFLLLGPIFIVLGLNFSGILINITSVLAIIVFVYLLGFTFVKDRLPNFLKYLFFIVLGIYIFITNSFLSFQSFQLEIANFITVIIVSFVFMITSYYLSTKKDLQFLYSIGTIGGILTLAPVIVDTIYHVNDNNTQFYISIGAIIIFSISNWILPFLNKGLINSENKRNIVNLLLGVISGLLFIGYELFAYGSNYFPGVSLGGAFAILAIIYFVLADFMLRKIGIQNIKKQEFSKNIMYTYLGVSISIFSLSIALIFSEYEYIVSSIWLFEATLMFYFYYKTNENKIFSAGIILFMIGVFKLFYLIDIVNTKDFIFLIPFTLIFISYVYNIKFLESTKSGMSRVFHDILHILGISTLAFLLLKIIPSTGHGWSTLGIASFLLVLNFVYSYFSSHILKVFFIFIFSGFLFSQIGNLDSILWKIDYDNIGYMRILQYTATVLAGIIVYIWNKINKEKSYNIFINIIFSIYLLLITSSYVYDIFDSTFAVTIYWGVTASILLFYGIAKDYIKLRTIGLYLVSITTLKIFLYDLWFGLDDAFSRVIAFIVIGVLLIIISTRYTKKYGNNLKGEFNFSNFYNGNNTEKSSISTNKKPQNITKIINKKIEKIDVSDIRGIKFYINGGDTVEIRAENLIKIVKLITNDFTDTKFEKGELVDTYNYVLENFKSDLSKATYDKILLVLNQFIEQGGEVDAIYKK
ncbi:MAG: DUF2339 domain-containing protein [Candidatus Gracilibacteria bacterium]|nr:DUF2339 domain-containing protein [Candidatus Gracilibacteria bacterium]